MNKKVQKTDYIGTGNKKIKIKETAYAGTKTKKRVHKTKCTGI